LTILGLNVDPWQKKRKNFENLTWKLWIVIVWWLLHIFAWKKLKIALNISLIHFIFLTLLRKLIENLRRIFTSVHLYTFTWRKIENFRSHLHNSFHFPHATQKIERKSTEILHYHGLIHILMKKNWKFYLISLCFTSFSTNRAENCYKNHFKPFTSRRLFTFAWRKTENFIWLLLIHFVFHKQR